MDKIRPRIDVGHDWPRMEVFDQHDQHLGTVYWASEGTWRFRLRAPDGFLADEKWEDEYNPTVAVRKWLEESGGVI